MPTFGKTRFDAPLLKYSLRIQLSVTAHPAGQTQYLLSLNTAEGSLSRVVVSPHSLEEQLSKFPAELLDSPCADAHLVKLTESFSEWQISSTGLELSKAGGDSRY